MATPIKNLVLADLAADLRKITTANGYQQTVKRVYESPVSMDYNGELPCLWMWESGCLPEAAANVGFSTVRLTVTVAAAVADNDDRRLALDKLMADVEKAVLADYTRGGYAWETLPAGDIRVVEIPDMTPSARMEMDFEISFDHQFGDPYTQ